MLISGCRTIYGHKSITDLKPPHSLKFLNPSIPGENLLGLRKFALKFRLFSSLCQKYYPDLLPCHVPTFRRPGGKWCDDETQEEALGGVGGNPEYFYSPYFVTYMPT